MCDLLGFSKESWTCSGEKFTVSKLLTFLLEKFRSESYASSSKISFDSFDMFDTRLILVWYVELQSFKVLRVKSAYFTNEVILANPRIKSAYFTNKLILAKTKDKSILQHGFWQQWLCSLNMLFCFAADTINFVFIFGT